jgi:hydroxyacylglutathione hydrolase
MSENRAAILQIPLGPLQTNCYVLVCNATRHAAVIDPGWDGRLLYERITAEKWSIKHILLTHTHFDHVGGLAALKAASGAPIAVHAEAIPMLENAGRAADLWQIAIDPCPPADTLLSDGDIVEVGELQLDVLFTP